MKKLLALLFVVCVVVASCLYLDRRHTAMSQQTLPECNAELVVKSEVITGSGTPNANVTTQFAFPTNATNLPCYKDLTYTARDVFGEIQTTTVRLNFDCKRLPNGRCKKN